MAGGPDAQQRHDEVQGRLTTLETAYGLALDQLRERNDEVAELKAELELASKLIDRLVRANKMYIEQ